MTAHPDLYGFSKKGHPGGKEIAGIERQTHGDRHPDPEQGQRDAANGARRQGQFPPETRVPGLREHL